MLKYLTAVGLIAVSTSALVSAPAQARIECKGPYQYIRGTGLHATPYCEIHNLYKVARNSYGISTSFRRLRNNNTERQEVCQAIGHDNRVESVCLEYRNEGGDQFQTR